VAGPSQSSDHRTCVLLWYSVGLSAPMACRVVLSAIHGAIAAHLSNLCSLRTPLTPYHPRACVVRRRTNQVLRSPEYFWMLSMFAISILIRFGEKKFNAVLIFGHAALPRQSPKKVFCGLRSAVCGAVCGLAVCGFLRPQQSAQFRAMECPKCRLPIRSFSQHLRQHPACRAAPVSVVSTCKAEIGMNHAMGFDEDEEVSVLRTFRPHAPDRIISDS
jgi:hypothetical protein